MVIHIYVFPSAPSTTSILTIQSVYLDIFYLLLTYTFIFTYSFRLCHLNSNPRILITFTDALQSSLPLEYSTSTTRTRNVHFLTTHQDYGPLQLDQNLVLFVTTRIAYFFLFIRIISLYQNHIPLQLAL